MFIGMFWSQLSTVHVHLMYSLSIKKHHPIYKLNLTDFFETVDQQNCHILKQFVRSPHQPFVDTRTIYYHEDVFKYTFDNFSDVPHYHH